MERKLVKVDTLVIGSGITAQILKARRPATVLVDASYAPGGLYAVLKTPLGMYSRCPAFSEEPLRGFLEVETEVTYLKDGDYESKVYAYEDPSQFQRTRFLDIVKHAEHCSKLFLSLNPIKAVVGRPYTPIVANIRAIHVEKQLVTLNNGMVITFSNLVYTWPLDRLPTLVRSCPKDLYAVFEELLPRLRSVRMLASMLIVRDVESLRHDRITVLIHATRASRIHTIIAIPLNSHTHLVYVYTSFGDRYRLLPGIIEKFFSELRRFLGLRPKNIVDEHHYEYSYFAISRVEESIIGELCDELKKFGIVPEGRLGLWQEISLRSIVERYS